MSNDLEYARLMRNYRAEPDNPSHAQRIANHVNRLSGAIPDVDKAIKEEVKKEVAKIKQAQKASRPNPSSSSGSSYSGSNNYGSCPPCPVKQCPAPPPCPIVTCPMPPPCPIVTCPTALGSIRQSFESQNFYYALVASGAAILAYNVYRQMK